MEQSRAVIQAWLTRALPGAWVVCVALLITAPMLAPGFILSYDMVFTPRQDLLPASVGLGGGLPRAVPQDAVVALVEYVVPGMIVQKVIILAIPVLTGFGMLRLLATAGRRAAVVAATLAMVAPFVTERLIIGHWALLLAYALTPWALHLARRLRREGGALDAVRLVLVMALAGLTPSGSLLVTFLALPIAVGPGAHLSGRLRALVSLAALGTWLPWLLPALVHPNAGVSDSAGAEVFALRSEGPWGLLLTALGTGGVWNADVVPVSRTLILAPVAAGVVVVLALVGAAPAVRVLGRATVGWWATVSVAGLVGALMSGSAPWAWFVEVIPGAGLLRDAHKLLAPLALLLAAAAGLGVARVARRIPDATGAGAVVVAAMLLPLLLQPDALWGAGGRLRPVEYPAAWQDVRDRVNASDQPGDVLVLPWTAFRQYPWNDDRTMLDPAPRWLPRPSVVSDDLTVSTSDGLVVVSGDDPRAREVGEALSLGRDVTARLGPMGVGWVLLDGPGQLPSGLVPDQPLDGLTLAQVPGSITIPPVPAGSALVIVVDLFVVLGLTGAAVALGAARVNRRRHGRSLLR